MTTPEDQDRPAPRAGSGPGATIGRYRLERKLGSGSFATVWLGHDDDLDVPVAVKVLADNWCDNEDVRGRFLGEARIMRKIRDPRIVRVYDIGTLPDGRPYFVMDYADGGSLEDLRKHGLPPVRALRLCAQACRALNVLHEHDVVHRDVTPGNILLNHTSGGDVQVMIADLGVAKSMVGQVGATMTAGTPAYMALEQATGIGHFDHRADVYSLAAVTYAMLTGHPPFHVRTLKDLLTRDPNQLPEPIAQRVGAPPMLDTVLRSALSPQPGRRPPTAAVLADALDQIATTMAGGPPQGPAALGGPGSPITYPTPSSYLPGSGMTPHSLIGPGGYPVPQGSAPQGSMAQGSMAQGPMAQGPMAQGPMAQGSIAQGSIAQGSIAQGSMAQQPAGYPGSTAPQPRPAADPVDDEEDGTTRSKLFYLFVGLAALALFFLTLLLTVLLLR